jgi:hypothetical protein
VLQKTKEGVFIGPQTHNLLGQFDQILICNEKRTYNDLWLLAAYFLGSTKADNRKELVEILLLSFPKLGQDIYIHISFFFIITSMFVQISLRY